MISSYQTPAVGKLSPLECLSQERAEKKLTELLDALWVQSARAILGLRRFLRARYLNSRLAPKAEGFTAGLFCC